MTRTIPRVIGHEISGVIEEMGEGVQGYEPGQRVCVAPQFRLRRL